MTRLQSLALQAARHVGILAFPPPVPPEPHSLWHSTRGRLRTRLVVAVVDGRVRYAGGECTLRSWVRWVQKARAKVGRRVT